MFKLIIKYIKNYFLSILFFGYLIISVILKALSKIDITISCPIKYVTGKECLGCGLTEAATNLLKLKISLAWQSNPLVFIVLPVLLFLVIRHWREFMRTETNLKNKHQNQQL